jgi:hypothetical protein
MKAAALLLLVACSGRGAGIDAAVADASIEMPIADPIPAGPMPSGVTVVLEEVVTMPPSQPAMPPTDPRLQRTARINYLGEVPDGSGRLFVPDLNGRLYLVAQGTPHVYLDVAVEVGPALWSHRGLGSGFGFVAFHPRFGSNGIFYTVHTEAFDALAKTPDLPGQDPAVVHGVLTEWSATDPAADVFSGTRREILRIAFGNYIHGIQEIGFNPTVAPGDEDYGLLYLAVGDGGLGVTSGDAQNLGKPHGKILRIDPGGGGRYAVPSTNPLVGRAGALGEIYAHGLRDPYRFTWDSDGRLLLASIGEHNIESIYDVKPGDNFGWPEREGPFLVGKGDPTCGVYPLPADDARLGFTYPVAAFDHDAPADFPRCVDSGHAVIGGFVYRGSGVPMLSGQYVFADGVTGRLFHADASEMRRDSPRATIRALTLLDAQNRPVTMQDLAGDPRVDLRFGRDAAGELYVLSKANGKIWRVKAATAPRQIRRNPLRGR